MRRRPERTTGGCRIPAALVAAVLAVLGGHGGAHAEEEGTEPIRLAYRAPPACPDESQFVARIRARTRHVRPAWPGEAAREVSVDIDGTRPASGRLAIHDPRGARGTREVRAERCADVADALALMVALAIDPHAEAGPALAAGTGIEGGDATAAGVQSATPATPPASPPEPAPAPVPPGSVAEPPAAIIPQQREERMRSQDDGALSVGADVAVATGVTPRTLIGASPFVGWRARHTRSSIRRCARRSCALGPAA